MISPLENLQPVLYLYENSTWQILGSPVPLLFLSLRIFQTFIWLHTGFKNYYLLLLLIYYKMCRMILCMFTQTYLQVTSIGFTPRVACLQFVVSLSTQKPSLLGLRPTVSLS